MSDSHPRHPRKRTVHPAVKSGVMRQTRQRGAIREALDAAGRPLTPQEIHEAAKAHYPQIGLRTVYRQVKELVDSGELVGIDYPGQPLRYEPVTRRHQAHFICRLCDKLFSFPHEVGDVPTPPEPRFRVTGQETIFYGEGRGLCPKCPIDPKT